MDISSHVPVRARPSVEYPVGFINGGTMTIAFDLTYDYLCPFARNANEAVVEALDAGQDWDVTFRPFSLQENHNGADDTHVWDSSLDAEMGSGVRALLWSIAVREKFPESFPAFHVALFAARHDRALDVSDENVLRDVAAGIGLDHAAVSSVVSTGMPQDVLRDEHTALVAAFDVFGVPTFIADGEAVFVRIMDRHNVTDIQKTIEMLAWTNLNEFKRTKVER